MRDLVLLLLPAAALVGCDRDRVSQGPATVEADSPSVPPVVSTALPDVDVPYGTQADGAPWLDLAPIFEAKWKQSMEWSIFERDSNVNTDAQMRAQVCAAASDCDGLGPWVVTVADQAVWFSVLVDYDENGGWRVGTTFAEGGVAWRCDAETTIVRTGDRKAPAVRVEDSVQTCEVPGDGGTCGADEFGSGCGEMFTTSCAITFDPQSLKVLTVDGVCDAFEAGRAQGLTF